MTFQEFVRDVWPLLDRPWPAVDARYRETHGGAEPRSADRAFAYWRLCNLSRQIEAPARDPAQFAAHDFRAQVADLWPPAPPPVPASVPRAAQGHTRLDGRCFADARGPYAALGATYFYAPHSDPDRLDQNLRWLAHQGCDYIRILLMVGAAPYWPFHIQPRSWEAYQRVLETASAHGLRVQPVIFADAHEMMPDTADRAAFVGEVAAWCLQRRDQIQFIEVANESELNGVTLDELTHYCTILQTHCDIPFAASSPTGSLDPEEGLERLYRDHGCRSPLATPHFDRTAWEDGYRIIRQPWHYQFTGHQSYMPRAFINNEPAGYGAKQGGISIPEQFGMAALYTVLCGGAAYCWHTLAGVKGYQDDNQTVVNFEDTPGGSEMWSSMRSLIDAIPGNLANGEVANHHWTAPRHPLQPSLDDQIWTDGRHHGVVRAFARRHGAIWYVGLLGIDRYVDVVPNRDVRATLHHPVTGASVWQGDLAAGQTQRIEADGETRSYLLTLEEV